MQKKNGTCSQDQLKLAREFRVDPIIIQLLNKRDIISRDDIDDFLNPTLAKLPPPKQFQGIQEAVELIIRAIRLKSRIIIWGDYDVDGVTGTALLVNFFRSIGVEAEYHIPDRLTDGYGLNCKTLVQLKKETKGDHPLIITVDCGISNFTETKKAKDLGFSIIVTDHHEVSEEIPVADVIINPKSPNVHDIFYNLAGVGVAFYLVAGLRAELDRSGYFEEGKIQLPNMKNFLSFVALGSIADMVPLIGINRILVKGGFEALLEYQHTGLNALLESCDIHSQLITGDDIGFSIAPKINAAGRIGKAQKALELLLCFDLKKSKQLAASLTRMNNTRRKLTREVFAETQDRAKRLLDQDDCCVVLEGEYHPGVVGIVASQLVDRYRVPVIVFSRDKENNGNIILKGSARSVEGVNLFKILQKCERFLVKYGGHRQAAGLTISNDNFEGFKTIFNQHILSITEGKPIQKSFEFDLDVSVDKVFSGNVIRQLQLLEPYGVGNRQPVFRDEKTEPVQINTVGNGGNHIKVRFRGKQSNQNGIGFGLGHQLTEMRERRNHSIIYSPMLSRFKKSANWQVKILSIHPPGL